MLPALLTLPDTPVGSPKGIAHLFLVAVFGALSLGGIILCAILGVEPPDILDYIASGVAFYLLGANVATKQTINGGDTR